MDTAGCEVNTQWACLREQDRFLPTPTFSRLLGEVALTCRLGSAPSCAALFPGAQAECFPSSSSSSCALSVGLRQCPGLPRRPEPSPSLGSCPRAHQAVSNLDTMHLAPSDHNSLFDGTNDDLGLQGPQGLLRQIKSCLCADKGASYPASDPPPPGYTGREASLGDDVKVAADPGRQEETGICPGSTEGPNTHWGCREWGLAGLQRVSWAHPHPERLRATS